ncbi:MAG: hypothetical protein Q4A42_01130 [Tissierellia bacterium]|nr:hypothetical protein [Tissierellia bacterium]
MDYSKHATKLLITSALIYMVERVIKLIPYHTSIVLQKGIYGFYPEVPFTENIFVVGLLVIALVLYSIEIYLKFNNKQKEDLKK